MKNKCIFITLLFLLTSSIVFVYPNGKRDSSFYDIDENIKQKQYNDALILLNEYIKNNPEDFDNAQKRVNIIMDVRSEYAKLAEEIIYVIINEPTNDEKKLKMIAELEAIEENPSAATKEFISQTKAAAEFTYYRSKFEEIIVKGSEETKNQNYLESLRTNYTGFDLYRTHFHKSGYEEDFVNSVEFRIANVENMIDNYEKLKSDLDIAYRNLISSLDVGTISQSQNYYTIFEAKMKDLAEIRNTIVESGWYFRDSFLDLQSKNPELTEASFLAFAYRFVLGRNSTESSGMISALDTLWNNYTSGIKPYINNHVFTILEKNELALTGTNIIALINKNQESKIYLDEALAYVDIGISVENLNGLIRQEVDRFYSTVNTPEMIKLQHTKTMITSYKSILDDTLVFNEYLAKCNQFQVSENPENQVKVKDFSYKDFVFEINQNINLLDNNASNLLTQISFSYVDYQWKYSFDLLKDILNKVKSEYNILNSNNEKKLSSWFVKASNNITTGHKSLYEKCVEMLNENLSPDILSYPAELQPIMNNSIAEISSDIEVLKIIEDIYNVNLTSKNQDKSLIQKDIKTLSNLYNDCNVLISKAKERVHLAELAKNEADLRYNQAENALNKNDYASCRDYIEKARAKYNESLLYQESETLRTNSDAMLLALGEKIIRAENEIVVREVRELKTRAKNAYYSGNFESAENLLSQAKIRWASTNSESDIEIESLLSLVGNALSLKTGRTIAPTAPLYPEMSQLLNIANQYYNEGKNLFAKGQKTEATRSFEHAKEKLREVQTVYPLNQEASLLSLKIDKLIDEKSFNEYFARKVENAKSDYKDKTKQQTVYAELLDLYEINPSYPGLKDFIYNVEIALGIRVKPPDTSALKKSNQLTAQAQKVFDSDGRNEISLNAALQLINQALEANPDNTEAQILKDRISTSLGGTGTAVLPANAEKLYQQAVQELQKGNTLQAYAIVSKLMENKTYSKSSKIIDLMKKVESLL